MDQQFAFFLTKRMAFFRDSLAVGIDKPVTIRAHRGLLNNFADRAVGSVEENRNIIVGGTQAHGDFFGLMTKPHEVCEVDKGCRS